MTTYTIEADNNITAFASLEEAAAAKANTTFEHFTSLKELSTLAAKWPAARLVGIWNSLAGVKPVKSFKSAKLAAAQIWPRIEKLGDTQKPKTGQKAKGGAPAPAVPPAKGKASKKAAPAPKVSTGKKGAKHEGAGPREGSKTAQVIALLQRPDGVTLEEIMTQMGWQKHTVRGFMAGAMKKAGYMIESRKSSAGQRTYRITK